MVRRAPQIQRLAPRRENALLGPADRILVVGAGPAGTAAAEELRRKGFRGQLTMLCEDPGGSYDRPACSKGLITGTQRPRDARIGSDPRLEIDWKLGRAAVATDMKERVVWTQTGEGFRFDGLVIANGARPSLNGTWSGETTPHVIHNIEDAWGVRKELRYANKITVIGGGLTGCELACSVRSMGKDVTLVDPRNVLMSRALDETIGGLMTAEHAEDGTDLKMGRRVKGADRDGQKWILTLDNGEHLVSDMVVMTAGEKPDTAWLKGTGIDISDGVLCDEALRALDEDGKVVPHVVAAGTLARWPNLRMSNKPGRVGQWIAALDQGASAARALLAGDRAVPPATLIPRFWSSQLGLRIQVCGDIGPETEVRRMEKKPRSKHAAKTGTLVTHYKGRELVGVCSVNTPAEFVDVARALVLQRPRYELVSPVQVPVAVSDLGPRRLAATG